MTPKPLSKCRDLTQMAQSFVLDRVQTYVDPRAHIHMGELRYSIQNQKGEWVRAPVLRNKEMRKIFLECNSRNT